MKNDIDSIREGTIDSICMTWRADFWHTADAERKALREKITTLYDRHFRPVVSELGIDVERYATLKALAASMDVVHWENHRHGWRIDLIGDGPVDTILDNIRTTVKAVQSHPSCPACRSRLHPAYKQPQRWECCAPRCSLYRHTLSVIEIAARTLAKEETKH